MKCVHCYAIIDTLEFIAVPEHGNAVRCRARRLPNCPGYVTAEAIEAWAQCCLRGAGRKATVAVAVWLRSAPVGLVKRQAAYSHDARDQWQAERRAEARAEARALRGNRRPRRSRLEKHATA